MCVPNLVPIGPQATTCIPSEGYTHTYSPIYVYLSRKVSFWLLKIFEIQKGRTFNFNDILRLCTIVVSIAIRSRA